MYQVFESFNTTTSTLCQSQYVQKIHNITRLPASVSQCRKKRSGRWGEGFLGPSKNRINTSLPPRTPIFLSSDSTYTRTLPPEAFQIFFTDFHNGLLLLEEIVRKRNHQVFSSSCDPCRQFHRSHSSVLLPSRLFSITSIFQPKQSLWP